VTFSPKAERQYDNPEVLIIWEIRTGAKKRTFSEVYKTPWPVIRWSHDDRYFARMGPDTLSVYETPVSLNTHLNINQVLIIVFPELPTPREQKS
jgi:uncharacterized protein with WD repeat